MRRVMKKISALSYDDYKKKHPQSDMQKAEYEKKYMGDDAEKKHPTPPINPQKADKKESFKALVDFAVNKGRVNTAHEASALIRHLGYDEKEFADHLMDTLGK